MVGALNEGLAGSHTWVSSVTRPILRKVSQALRIHYSEVLS